MIFLLQLFTHCPIPGVWGGKEGALHSPNAANSAKGSKLRKIPHPSRHSSLER